MTSTSLPSVWILVALLIATASQAAPPLISAEENRVLSPYTGYTRDHWLAITEKLIAGVLPYFDPETGVPKLVGMAGETGHFERMSKTQIPVESLERSLMLVAIYTSATGKDRVPGYDGSITGPYLQGIIRGTDPEAKEYWGAHPPFSASGTNLAMAMLVSPRFLWDPLTPEQQSNLLDYLEELAHTPAYDCNCWYFPMMTVPLLEKHGRSANRTELTHQFERLLQCHRGDGWFIDSGNRTFDYYNVWGFQLYNQVLTHFDRQWKEEFGEPIQKTTTQMLESFPLFFGRDGGPIPWGRSTAYRFAMNSAIGAPLLNGQSDLPPGQARRIASGCLKYFWDNGAMSESGLLEPGYHGPNSVVAESYVRHGGPYWAAQGLLPLLLPKEHPFWTDKELPMPADVEGGRHALKGPEIALRVSPIDGEARLYPAGSAIRHQGRWQRGIKYFQHAYSSYLGWAATGEGGPDLGAGRSGVSLNGADWTYRTNPTCVRVEPDRVESTYDLSSGQVKTHTLIGNDGEVHIFWHTSQQPAYLHLGGYGISIPHGEEPSSVLEGNQILVQGGAYQTVMQVLSGPPGKLQIELLEPRQGWTHSHLLGGRGAFPYWRSDKPVPPFTPVAIFVNGTRDRNAFSSPVQADQNDKTLTVDLDGQKYLIELPLAKP